MVKRLLHPVLSQRALNRALLARQHLLQRVNMPVLGLIEALVGLQAQAPNPPYFGLWSRLEGFEQQQLSGLFETRQVVRIALLRSTIHLVSARDCLGLRPLLQPVLERGFQSNFGKQLPEIDQVALIDYGRRLVEAQPLTFQALGLLLQERWPSYPAAALAQALRTWLALVQVPPRGLWATSGAAAHTTAEHWLGRPLASEPDLAQLVRRYLAAFGPASVNDMQAWSGLTRLSSVFNQLRSELVCFCDEQGRELFDLPDAPRPLEETPAPPRLLAEFDNILLGHADRSRILSEIYRQRLFTSNGLIPGAILIDGFVVGMWKLQQPEPCLKLHLFEPISEADRQGLAQEAASLLHFATNTTDPIIQFE
ncbi:winged helix DNA-binding domain-containing protein [Herpetosiphon gulosus]|uniref:Winged helix DNA-binding domain-containing protein n=1 Tax=Herpetosiphon gulosus TaxID=1973496 RepID=A0ABP9WYL9_9CHLR